MAWTAGHEPQRQMSDIDEMRRAAAVKWYEMRRISQGKAAELCGVSRVQFVQILSDYRVSVLQDDPASLGGLTAGRTTPHQ